jgi:oligoendopeptidase F
MADFNYPALPHDFPRRYVPADFKFEWADLSNLFEELKARNVASVAELERWLADESELDSVMSEQRAIRYINNTRQTDNPEYRRAYESYTKELEPGIKLASFELVRKYIASDHRGGLPGEIYALEDKRRESIIKTFRPENVGLETEDSLLSQEYQRTVGAMTVDFRGEERTLQQMSKFYEETDRATRSEAWQAANGRALKDAPGLDEVYDKMVRLRDRAARNAGFQNYRDYIFVEKDRFDYTPEDCLRLHSAVEEYFVPLSREIDLERKEKMGLDELRPWDVRVDPEGRPPLNPFETVDGLVSGSAKVIAKVDQQFAGYFSVMSRLGLLDLDSRKGKAPGGYQEELSEVRLPFIFMNAARRDDDVRTLMHESGHSFHTFLMRERGLPFFNAGANVPTEFSEVASMSMELISGEHFAGTFYSEADARRSNKEELVSIVKLFTWVATIDAFQHWVYTHPEHSHDERASAWVSVYGRFCGLESFAGLQDSLKYRWQRQLHLYEVPFYYIEYGIATLGALGIWLRYREDPASAVHSYKLALSEGASKSLPELFGAAGLDWDLGPNAIEKYAEELRAAIREFSD